MRLASGFHPDTAHTAGDRLVGLPDDGVVTPGHVLVNDVDQNARVGSLASKIGSVDLTILAPPDAFRQDLSITLDATGG